MKRFFLLLIVLCLLLCGLGGCSLRTYSMDTLLPAPLDDATLLPLIDAVTVTRAADGASVTVTGTEVETLMLVFDGLVCTRKTAVARTDVYTLTFAMTDAEDVRPPLLVRKISETGELTLTIGEYEYYLVNTRLDTAYLEALFSEMN